MKNLNANLLVTVPNGRNNSNENSNPNNNVENSPSCANNGIANCAL
jgi:hypothetical protein